MRLAVNSEVFTFASDELPKKHFYVAQFEGLEALNELFSFELLLLCDDPEIDTEALVGTRADFTIKRPNNERTVFSGYIYKIVQRGFFHGYTYYSVSFCHTFAKFMLIVNSAVFLDNDLKQTIEKVMEQEPFFSVPHEFRFSKSYPKKEFAMQFEDNAFNYIKWCLEEQGVYFYFDNKGENVIFADNPKVHDPSQGIIYYSPATGLENSISEEVINSFELKQTMIPARVIVRNYNWKDPTRMIVGIAEVSKNGVGDVYLSNEKVDSEEDAKRIAKIRAEQILSTRRVFSGTGYVPFLRPGVVFTLKNHDTEKFNRDYIVTKIKHEGRQETLLNLVLGIPIKNEYGDHFFYRNTFECIESDTTYRSERTVKRNSVYGAIHASIAGDSNGEALIDKYGRYRVLFPFDVSGRKEGNTSCWIRRALEQTGKDFGLAFPLSPGTEVIVTFINGNPDLPIISGALANGESGSISGGGNSGVSGIRSDGGSQLVLQKNTVQVSDLNGNEIMFSSGSEDYMRKGTHIGLQGTSIASSSLAGAVADNIAGFISRDYADCSWSIYLLNMFAALAKTAQQAAEGLSEKNADPNAQSPDWGATITKLIPFILSVKDFIPYNAFISAEQKNSYSLLQCFPSKKELAVNFIVMAVARLGSGVADNVDMKKGNDITGKDSKYSAYPKDNQKRHKIAGQIAALLPELAVLTLMILFRKIVSKKKIGGIMIDAKDKNINLHASSYIGMHAERGIVLNAASMEKDFYTEWGSPSTKVGVKKVDPNIKIFFTDILNEPIWEHKKIVEVKDILAAGHDNRIKEKDEIGSGADVPESDSDDAKTTFIAGKTDIYYMNSRYSVSITDNDRVNNKPKWVVYAPEMRFNTLSEDTSFVVKKGVISMNAGDGILFSSFKRKAENENGQNETAGFLALTQEDFSLGLAQEKTISGLKIDNERILLSLPDNDKNSKLILFDEGVQFSACKGDKQASLTLYKDKAELKAKKILINGIGVDEAIFGKDGVVTIGGKSIKITSTKDANLAQRELRRIGNMKFSKQAELQE